MAARNVKRAVLTGITLLGVCAIGLALWQNISKRRGVDSSPLKTAQTHPDYAAALLAANQKALASFGREEKQREIAEGTLVFSKSDAEIIKSRARRALASAPLSVTAITQIATADFLQTLTWSDRDTLLLAKSRNARDRQTLSALSFIDLRGGNFNDLLDTMDLRHRLGSLPERELQIIRNLNTLAGPRALIETKLTNVPSWGFDYFKAVIPSWTEGEIKDSRSGLFAYLNAQPNDDIRRTVLSLYFNQLKQIELYGAALDDWNALPETQQSGPKTRPIYNTNFKALSAPLPFNWQTFQPALALAEIEAAGGLYASASAPTPSLIAQQTITAPTGQPLRLTMDGQWQYREQQGHFFWRLSCLPSGAPFYDMKIGDAARAKGQVSADISPLPQGCNFQNLELYSQPGGFNQRVSLRVSKIELSGRALSAAERQQQTGEGR